MDLVVLVRDAQSQVGECEETLSVLLLLIHPLARIQSPVSCSLEGDQ